jgi:hypothetical protein
MRIPRDVRERWKRAVVHLEAAFDRVPAVEHAEYMQGLLLQMQRGEITPDEFARAEQEARGPGLEDRNRGTALLSSTRGCASW